MPTIITHALLPLIGAAAVPRFKLSGRLLAVAMVAAVLPDADVVGRFLFGYPGTHPFGHRGWTHSLAFALLLAASATLLAPQLRTSGRAAFATVLLSTLSHPLTDMLTDGGRGVMLYWPLDAEKVRFAVRPVEISPLGLRGFETGRIWDVFLSEALWLIGPAVAVAMILRIWFHGPKPSN